MRFTPAIYAAAFIAVLLFSSCSSISVINENDPPGVVMEKVRARNMSIRTHIGIGKIMMDSPEFSGTGNIELRVSKPDSALVKITGPFGISIGSGLITSSNFTFYDGTNNAVMQGETNADNLRRAFKMSIEFDEILEILSGSFGFGMAPAGAIPKGGFSDGTYNLEFSTARGTEEYRVNTDYGAISRYILRNKDGNLTRDIKFRDFRRIDGVYLPHNITIYRPMHDESLSIVYDRQKINEMPIDFAFSAPDGARRIQL